MVEHVRGIGMNQQAVAATVAKAREQRLTALREEAPALEQEAVDEIDLALGNGRVRGTPHLREIDYL